MKLKSALWMSAVTLLVCSWASADVPGKHPYYLHALSDLRTARWMLQHRPGDAAVSANEDVAITEINKAIGAIKHAAIDDGKNLEDHPPVDTHEPRSGRLHKALAALHAAHDDVAKEEDNGFATGLRARAIHDIDEAIRFSEAGVHAAEQNI